MMPDGNLRNASAVNRLWAFALKLYGFLRRNALRVNSLWASALQLYRILRANLAGVLIAIIVVAGILTLAIFLHVQHGLPNATSVVDVSSTSSEVDFEGGGEEAEADAFEPLNEQVFRSLKTFLMTYELMVKDFKVFVYPDADPEIELHFPDKFCEEHDGEVYFVKNLLESKFVTKNPEEAHLFFAPISCEKWSEMTYQGEKGPRVLKDFVREWISKYPYWNRKLGADHFYFARPGLGEIANTAARFLLKNSFRLVPLPTHDNESLPNMDVVLPQPGHYDCLPARAFDSMDRLMLNFWIPSEPEVRDARMSAYKEDQLDVWRNPQNWHYQMEWYRNIFCICPDELQAIGPCITASIHLKCVPGKDYTLYQQLSPAVVQVVWSDWYVLPFDNILDWKKFSVVLKERDVSGVKKVLDGIDDAERDTLKRNTAHVQRLLQWNSPAKKHDAFHMVMYNLWMRHYNIRYSE